MLSSEETFCLVFGIGILVLVCFNCVSVTFFQFILPTSFQFKQTNGKNIIDNEGLLVSTSPDIITK